MNTGLYLTGNAPITYYSLYPRKMIYIQFYEYEEKQRYKRLYSNLIKEIKYINYSLFKGKGIKENRRMEMEEKIEMEMEMKSSSSKWKKWNLRLHSL